MSSPLSETPPRRAALVLCGPGGVVLGRLPEVAVETPWWQDIEPVVDAVRDGVRHRCRRAPDARQRAAAGARRPRDVPRGGGGPTPARGRRGARAVGRRARRAAAATPVRQPRRSGRGRRVGRGRAPVEADRAGRACRPGALVEPVVDLAAAARRYRAGVAQGGPAVLRARGRHAATAPGGAGPATPGPRRAADPHGRHRGRGPVRRAAAGAARGWCRRSWSSRRSGSDARRSCSRCGCRTGGARP